jgi:hypothetical protein
MATSFLGPRALNLVPVTTTVHLVLQQTSQELNLGPLLGDGLLVPEVEGLQNARQPEPFQERNHLMPHRSLQ